MTRIKYVANWAGSAPRPGAQAYSPHWFLLWFTYLPGFCTSFCPSPPRLFSLLCTGRSWVQTLCAGYTVVSSRSLVPVTRRSNLVPVTFRSLISFWSPTRLLRLTRAGHAGGPSRPSQLVVSPLRVARRAGPGEWDEWPHFFEHRINHDLNRGTQVTASSAGSQTQPAARAVDAAADAAAATGKCAGKVNPPPPSVASPPDPLALITTPSLLHPTARTPPPRPILSFLLHATTYPSPRPTYSLTPYPLPRKCLLQANHCEASSRYDLPPRHLGGG